ncbi:MAG: ribonuclease HII [Anaerolineae bacterium]|jgi:ribonuclease HII
MSNSPFPDLAEEYVLRASGHTYVAGLDEAGRGAWAGPVCAAAVVLPLDRDNLGDLLDGVRDSKLLTAKRREELLPVVCGVALAVGVGWAEPADVDRFGVVAATQQAMTQAVEALNGQMVDQAGALLIDHLRLPGLNLPQRVLPKADCRCLTVAAASIVAKVERDRRMIALDEDYPGYGFARHKGYGTRQHREALRRLGPAPIHRMSWRPIRQRIENE